MVKDRLVYSTDSGRVCQKCERAIEKCNCEMTARTAVRGDGNILIRRETKGRGGKIVTAISGLPLNQSELASLLSELKRLCGAGGTVKDESIEIQGSTTMFLGRSFRSAGSNRKGSL